MKAPYTKLVFDIAAGGAHHDGHYAYLIMRNEGYETENSEEIIEEERIHFIRQDLHEKAIAAKDARIEELEQKLATASKMFDEVENALADALRREQERGARIKELEAKLTNMNREAQNLERTMRLSAEETAELKTALATADRKGWERGIDEAENAICETCEKCDGVAKELCAAQRRVSALPYMEPKEKTLKGCEWVADTDGDTILEWRTSCGKSWGFVEDGGPLENEMKYCHNCGRLISVAKEEPHE